MFQIVDGASNSLVPVCAGGSAGRREVGRSSVGDNFLLRSGRGALPILAACDERWTGGGAG